MFKFCLSFFQLLFKISFKKHKDIILTLLLLKWENEILKRHLQLKNKKVSTVMQETFIISIIGSLSKRAISYLTIVKPQTLLSWPS